MSLPTGARNLLVFALFLVSGACGLIYEVLWSKQLGLIFGNTVQSMSAVLTAFMGGLALGSFFAGRMIHRFKRPLLAYGVLEIIIGLYCALLPWFFSNTGPVAGIYRALYTESGSPALAVARFAISFMLLLIPTTFMGATLPLLSQFLVSSRKTLGRTVGALYAINSFGAVLGAAGTGFFLLPMFGKLNTNWIAVACNLTLGIAAIVLGRNVTATHSATEHAAEAAAENTQTPQAPVSSAGLKAAVITFGVTGFAAMAMQIGWTRAISLATGSSTYAFSLIVSVFILGLSFGGFWGARQASRVVDPLAALGRTLLLIALASLVVTALLGVAPTAFFFIMSWSSERWALQQFLEALAIGALIFVPTFFMGATTPLTMQVAARSGENTGRVVGTVYAVNTVGAILGSFLGGTLLLPYLQIQSTLELMALLYAVPGLILIGLSATRTHPRTLASSFAIAVPLVLLVLFSSRWDPQEMASGFFLLRDTSRVQAARQLRLLDALPPKLYRVLYYKEGSAATVGVLELNGILTLTVNGKPDASSHGDMPTQLMSVLMPALLHPGNVEEVLVIGLGSGVTTGAALAMDSVKRVDIVEMSPEVIEASEFFKPYNYLTYSQSPRVWIDTPKVEVLVNDGRNHLLLSKRSYDLISSEPSNPWTAGTGNLFTRESFQLSRSRLKPGGIMCQWLQGYSLEASDFFSVIRTFAEVFPSIQLCAVAPGDYLLIGSESDLSISYERIKAQLNQPRLKEMLSKIEYDTAPEFLANLFGQNPELRELSKDAPLCTDDNVRLEFSSPKALHVTKQKFRQSMISRAPERLLTFEGSSDAQRSEFLKEFDLSIASREHNGSFDEGVGAIEKHKIAARKLTPRSHWTREFVLVDLAFTTEKQLRGQSVLHAPDAAAALEMLKNHPPLWPHERWPHRTKQLAHAQFADQLIKDNKPDEALAELKNVQLPDLQAASHLAQARAYLLKKDHAKAREWALSAAGKWRANPAEAALIIMRIEQAEGKPDRALALIQSVVNEASAQNDPKLAPLFNAKATLLAKQKEFPAALEAVQAALRQDPANAGYALLRAQILESLGRNDEAVESLHWRAALLPIDVQARADLSLALMRAASKSEGHKALAYLHRSRRAAREATVVEPDYARGWEMLCRSFLALEKFDAPSAAFYHGEARLTYQKVLSLHKDDITKIPESLNALKDVTPEFKPNH